MIAGGGLLGSYEHMPHGNVVRNGGPYQRPKVEDINSALCRGAFYKSRSLRVKVMSEKALGLKLLPAFLVTVRP